MKDIWDIVRPLDEWERLYAHMEYLRHGLHIPFSKRIKVKHVTV